MSIGADLGGQYDEYRNPPPYNPPKALKSDGGSSSYYDIPEGTRDILDLIDHQKMPFGIGNIFKACYRYGRKAGIDKRYDLKKIIFFAQRELEQLDKAP